MPTADHRILPNGTAYMTDAGMTGDYDSIIGMDKEEPVSRFLTGLTRGRFEAASGAGTVSGVIVDVDERTGLAIRIEPVRMGPWLNETTPSR